MPVLAPLVALVLPRLVLSSKTLSEANGEVEWVVGVYACPELEDPEQSEWGSEGSVTPALVRIATRCAPRHVLQGVAGQA